jgi:hypothetical protein
MRTSNWRGRHLPRESRKMERSNDALANAYIPSKGERIELAKSATGVRARGTVFYADQLQILVKLDNGRSQSLRAGREAYRIIE